MTGIQKEGEPRIFVDIVSDAPPTRIESSTSHTCLHNKNTLPGLEASTCPSLFQKSDENKSISINKTPHIYKSISTEQLKGWHGKLAHFADESVVRTLAQAGVNTKIMYDGKTVVSHNCPDCRSGKAKKVGHPKVARQISKIAGSIWHFDVFGPTKDVSKGGAHYAGVLADEGSKFSTVFFASHKIDSQNQS